MGPEGTALTLPGPSRSPTRGEGGLPRMSGAATWRATMVWLPARALSWPRPSNLLDAVQGRTASRMAIIIKREPELRRMRDAGRIVAEILALLRDEVRPGVSTAELDSFVERELRARGATPSFKGYGRPPFPASICAAVNDQVVHGIPSARQLLRPGDIVGIDVGANYKGFHGDACITYPVGEVAEDAARLLRVTEECLALGVAEAREGKRLGDIGHAIQTHAEDAGFSVVRTLVGHGLGRKLHEEPSVPHFGEPETGLRIQRGMVFTIEPMINQGSHEWRELSDGWTVITRDGKLSAQFEHTVAITANGTEVLTKLD